MVKSMDNEFSNTVIKDLALFDQNNSAFKKPPTPLEYSKYKASADKLGNSQMNKSIDSVANRTMGESSFRGTFAS